MSVKHLLKDKTIIVTGSASGIGYETARILTEQGARVLGVDMNKSTDNVEEFYQADLSDKRTIETLAEMLPDYIDGIANIAGLPPTAPAEKVLAVNLVGLKYFTELMIPKLGEGASIVNLASLAGIGWPQSVEAIKASEKLDFENIKEFITQWKVGNEGGRSYFFTKEALVVWTLKNRWTWRDRGIRMNSISPGPIDTPILQDFLETLGARAEEDARIMDRTGTPMDIAPVVAFLLSDMSSWIRGTNIAADGGMFSNILCETHNV